jgi:hypothetical protein
MRGIQKCHKMSHLVKNVGARFFESGPCPTCQVSSSLFLVSDTYIGCIHKKLAGSNKKRRSSTCFFQKLVFGDLKRHPDRCRRSPPPRRFCQFHSHWKATPLASNARHQHVTRAIRVSRKMKSVDCSSVDLSILMRNLSTDLDFLKLPFMLQFCFPDLQ